LFAVILVYVDDVIIANNDSFNLKSLKGYLASWFLIKYLGSLKYFLNLEVAHTSEGIVLSQRKYTRDIFKEMDMMASKLVKFPIEQHHRLDLDESYAL